MHEGYEDLPILIRTTTNADHDASARRSQRFNSPIIANDSTPLFASPHQRIDTSLREPTPTTPMFRLPSSNISPCLLQLAKQRSRQDLEKDVGASICLWSWLRGLTLFFFFLDLFIFPILDYKIYLIVVFELHEKQKKKNTTSAKLPFKLWNWWRNLIALTIAIWAPLQIIIFSINIWESEV